MSTTLEAIIAEQVALLEALTPTAHSERAFRESEQMGDFREWAAGKPQACWRRFSIQDLWDYDVPEVTGGDVVFMPSTVEVVIAYPKTSALYGANNSRDMRDMMRADSHQIADEIGMWGTENMSDSTAVRRSQGYEDLGDVVVSVATYRCYFYRAIL